MTASVRRSELLIQARRDSLRVPCRACGAAEGAVCVDGNGTPLQFFPAHDARLKDAGVTLPGLTERDRGLLPSPMSPDAAGEMREVEARIRIAELRGNLRAGDITDDERAELQRLEGTYATAPAAPPAPRESDEDTPGWMRGPGHRR